MPFEPPRCPFPDCRNHRHPVGRFFWRIGSYKPRCRRAPVPRYRCRRCRRSFSRQTFRPDRRDRRPETNARLLALLTSGVGLRQTGRLCGLDVHSVQGKLRKYGAHAELLHGNLSRRLPAGRTYVLDEEETYECASVRPLTVPMLIESRTWFIVSTAVGPIRRLAPVGTARRRRQEEDERRHGRRRDESRRRVREVLTALERRVEPGQIVIRTDQKSSYATLIAAVFGERATHLTTSGEAPRTLYNPLFAINQTIAMGRDNCGRLRRKSWLVTKNADDLQRQLALFTVYRNYVRRRFNRDAAHESPAQQLGLLPRALSWREVLRWRQDWGALTSHPMSGRGDRTLDDFAAAA